jgi:hypothetical protein
MRTRFWYYLAMNTWAYVGIIIAVAIASSVFTYLLTRLRVEKASTERVRALAEAVAALENERAKFEQAARGIEESAKRKALDEFLADLHVEERHYVRQHRVLFAHRKSLVLEERIFFRNVPISNWVEHEVPVEEGADLDGIAKTLSVFNALEGETSATRSGRRLMFRAG